MDIKVVTISEFAKLKQEYFTTSGNENKVIKCIGYGFMGGGYQFWTKHRTSQEELVEKYWRFEPVVRRWFETKEQMAAEMTKFDIRGICYRWLFHEQKENGELVIQPYVMENFADPKQIEDKIANDIESSLHDRFFGMFHDPYTYVGELPYYKDEEGKEHFNDKEPALADPDNYRVFMVEMTAEEFDKQEENFINCVHGTPYNDGLLSCDGHGNFELTPEYIEFLKEHTNFSFEDGNN